MEWALRDLFVAYIERMKMAARDSYKHDVLVWAVLAAAGGEVKHPDPPAVLSSPKIVIGG
jgi:hypothetical protein